MATQLEVFWQGVKESAARIRASIAQSSRQPRDGSCFIVSTFGPQGRVTEASVFDPMQKVGSAAYCIQSGTHRLATDAEVEAYQKERAARQADRMSGRAAGTTKVL
jgi:hypothetical protein